MDHNQSRVACQCLLNLQTNTKTKIKQERWDPWVDSSSPSSRNRRWLQSTRIVTCSCERSRTFPRSRARQKKIESHPHREALQADLQQNNVYNPFSNNSKEMIRELGNVELFDLCDRKCNVLNVFSIGIKELSTAPAGSSWLKANPEESLINWDWMLSLSRTTWSRKGVAVLRDTAKLKNRKSTI